MFLHIATDLLHRSVGGNSTFYGFHAPPLIVGYQSLTVSAGSTTAVGIQFEDIADSKGEIALENLITPAAPLGWNSLNNNADQIWLFTGYDWTKYYFYASNTRQPANGYWVLSTDATHKALDGSVKLKAGQCVFFRRSSAAKSDAAITLAGGVVPLAATRSFTVGAGSTTAMAWPWPEGMKFSDFNACNSAKLGWNALNNNADQIWLFTGYDWTKYYFYASNTRQPATGYWVLSTDGTHENLDETKILDAGGAFFFRRSSAAKTDAVIDFTR